MSVLETYSITADFTGLTAADPDLFELDLAVQDSAITTAFEGVTRRGTDDDVSFQFAVAPTAGEITILDGLVAAHTGDEPLSQGGTKPHGVTTPRAPTVNDDGLHGFTEGTFWADTSASPTELYFALSVDTGAADWELMQFAATSNQLGIQDEGVDVPNSPHGTLNFVGDGVVVTDAGSGVAQVSIDLASGNDIKTKVSANDTTTDFLENQLASDQGVVLTTLNDGADESLQVGLVIDDLDFLLVNDPPEPDTDYVPTRTDGQLSKEEWTRDPGNLLKDQVYTRTLGQISQRDHKVYDTDGSTILAHLQGVYTRTGGTVTKIDWTRVV